MDDSARAEQEEPHPLQEVLEKKTNRRYFPQAWQRKIFSLDEEGGNLRYQRIDGERVTGKVRTTSYLIPLTNATVSTPTDGDSKIAVVTERRTFAIRCPSSTSAKLWARAIRLVAKKRESEEVHTTNGEQPQPEVSTPRDFARQKTPKGPLASPRKRRIRNHLPSKSMPNLFPEGTGKLRRPNSQLIDDESSESSRPTKASRSSSEYEDSRGDEA